MLTRRPPAPPADLLARCQATIPEQAKTLPVSGRPTPDRGSLLRFAGIATATAAAFSLWFAVPGLHRHDSQTEPLLARVERATRQVDYLRIEGRALMPSLSARAKGGLRFNGPWYPNRFFYDRRLGTYAEIHWNKGFEQRLTLLDGRTYWRRGALWQVTPGNPRPDVVNPALTTIVGDPRESLATLFPGQGVRNLTRSSHTQWKGRPAERLAFVTEVDRPVREVSREGVVLFVDPRTRRLMAVQRFIVRGDSWDVMFAEFELFYDRRASDTTLLKSVLSDVSRSLPKARQPAR